MEQIIRLFLGAAAEYVLAFLKNFAKARADNPKLWSVATEIIQQIAVAHPEWPGEQKRSYAFDAIKVAWRELLKDTLEAGKEAILPDNSSGIVNTMIELIVQKLRA